MVELCVHVGAFDIVFSIKRGVEHANNYVGIVVSYIDILFISFSSLSDPFNAILTSKSKHIYYSKNTDKIT